MPGYRALSSLVTGAAADNAREAQALAREGDPLTAVHLLEEAIAASLAVRSEMPGWLCGRLAALYRTIGRYDDEVMLLERYRESQSAEEARSRFEARLSKARTIAERKRRTENGALASVTKVLGARRRRRSAVIPVPPPAAPPAPVPVPVLARISAVLGDPAIVGDEDRLAIALGELASSARDAGVPVEQLVSALRLALQPERRAPGERDPRYSAALLRILAVYFDEADR
jgi:hypothetical protein